MPKLLPLIAADCASFTSERTPKKTKRIQIRLPAPRWSNRVYPRNHALFNPRPQERDDSDRNRDYGKNADLSRDEIAAQIFKEARFECVGIIGKPARNVAADRPLAEQRHHQDSRIEEEEVGGGSAGDGGA